MGEEVDGGMEEEQKRKRNTKQCTSEAMHFPLVAIKQVAHLLSDTWQLHKLNRNIDC